MRCETGWQLAAALGSLDRNMREVKGKVAHSISSTKRAISRTPEIRNEQGNKHIMPK